jgi:hypothetical protein
MIVYMWCCVLCIILPDCRTADDPCGKELSPACYEDVSTAAGGTGECVATCSLSSFYAASTSTGTCEVKGCTSRARNVSETLQCGADEGGTKCYWDPNDAADGLCKTACTNEAHYEGNENNVCVLKACSSRTTNEYVLFFFVWKFVEFVFVVCYILLCMGLGS